MGCKYEWWALRHWRPRVIPTPLTSSSASVTSHHQLSSARRRVVAWQSEGRRRSSTTWRNAARSSGRTPPGTLFVDAQRSARDVLIATQRLLLSAGAESL